MALEQKNKEVLNTTTQKTRSKSLDKLSSFKSPKTPTRSKYEAMDYIEKMSVKLELNNFMYRQMEDLKKKYESLYSNELEILIDVYDKYDYKYIDRYNSIKPVYESQ